MRQIATSIYRPIAKMIISAHVVLIKSARVGVWRAPGTFLETPYASMTLNYWYLCKLPPISLAADVFTVMPSPVGIQSLLRPFKKCCANI